jgi:hypothetical protein
MTDRLYASLFYVAFVVGTSWITVSLGETLTRSVLTNMALLPSRDAGTSRVDTFLAAKDRDPRPTTGTAKVPMIPRVPTETAGALARAMDEAETAHPDPIDEEKPGSDAKFEASVPEVQSPRVAGWSKRLPKRALQPAQETSSHIIMRSLRAEM